MSQIPRFLPWLDMEEAEVIEEASRKTGKIPAQFLKDAGLALALEVLDGKGRGGEATTRERPHPRPATRNTYPPLKDWTENKKPRDQRQPPQPIKPKPLAVL